MLGSEILFVAVWHAAPVAMVIGVLRYARNGDESHFNLLAAAMVGMILPFLTWILVIQDSVIRPYGLLKLPFWICGMVLWVYLTFGVSARSMTTVSFEVSMWMAYVPSVLFLIASIVRVVEQEFFKSDVPSDEDMPEVAE